MHDAVDGPLFFPPSAFAHILRNSGCDTPPPFHPRVHQRARLASHGTVERCGSPDLDAIDTARPIMRALGPRRPFRFVLSFEPAFSSTNFTKPVLVRARPRFRRVPAFGEHKYEHAKRSALFPRRVEPPLLVVALGFLSASVRRRLLHRDQHVLLSCVPLRVRPCARTLRRGRSDWPEARAQASDYCASPAGL